MEENSLSERLHCFLSSSLDQISSQNATGNTDIGEAKFLILFVILKDIVTF